MKGELTESALLLIFPGAEDAVGAERERLDRAAQDGIPAHMSVIYPFKPLEWLTAGDHRRLEWLADESARFSVRVSRCGWFGDNVVYLAPDDPAPVALLTRRVHAVFPDFPPYAGQFVDVVPHLTIGHDQSVRELEAAECAVTPRLPFTQPIDHMELWSGPAVEGRTQSAPPGAMSATTSSAPRAPEL